MSSYKLNFKKFTGGEIIRTYSNNELYGYVIIESDEPIYDSVLTDLHLNFINADKPTLPKREAILRAKTELLKKFVEEFNGKDLLGRVTVFECLEDEIPYEIQKQFLRDDIPLEQAISPFLKTFKYKTNLGHNNNEEQFILKKNNKRILQFMNYSPVIKGDIIISEYDINVLQNIIDVFTKYIREDEEVEIKKYDSLLIRLIKQTKLTQIAESKQKKENEVRDEKNKILYLKTASFFLKDNKLLNFYVEYKRGENPFGTFLPISFKGHKDTLFGFHNRPPKDFKSLYIANISRVFKGFDYDFITDELTYAISASMCFYYCQKTNHEFNLDVFKEFYFLERYNFSSSNELVSLPTYLDPDYKARTLHPEKPYLSGRMYDGEVELDWSEIHNFFTEKDYTNYLVFVENFEGIVNSNSSLTFLFSGMNEIILAELVLKNIAKPYFVVIEEYHKETMCGLFDNENQLRYFSLKQSEVIINNVSLRSAFNISLKTNIPFNNKFSLSTHIDYIDDGKGNYSIKYNLPASQNDVIGSNFSLNFSNKDVIEVNLAQVMRYSQNYIDFKNSGNKENYLDFDALREFFTPIFPKDYVVGYNNFEGLFNSDPKLADYYKGPQVLFKKGFKKELDLSKQLKYDSGIDFRFSYLYQFLKNKNILSNKFIEYCKYLHKLTFSSENIYVDDLKIFIPFWEIPRMQQIVLENFLKNYYLEIEYDLDKLNHPDSENDFYFNEAADGLDDFYNDDPDWYWNID